LEFPQFDIGLGSVFQFNRKPADGVKFLVTENLRPHEAKAIAEFLRDTPGLDKVLSLRSLFKSASDLVVSLENTMVLSSTKGLDVILIGF
jgi:hypothetical protein